MRETFYKKLLEAVKDGLKEVKKVQDENKYIGQHFSWVKIDYRENGMPNLHETSYSSGPTDYGQAFLKQFPDREPLIKSENISSINNFLKYCLQNDDLCKYLRFPGTEESKTLDSFLQIKYLIIVGNLLDRYIHVFDSFDLVEDNFKIIYNPYENFLFNENLNLNICVPILFLKFDFDEYKIAENYKIKRMSDNFHMARFSKKAYGPGVHESVLSAATHCFVIEGYHLKRPDNHWQVFDITSNTQAYPLNLINSFFGAIRIATGHKTGYAQLLIEPIDWAFGYKHKLPNLAGTSIRSYPTWFENFYWNDVNLPTLNESQNDHIKSIFEKLLDIKEKSIQIAVRRLNQCFLRENDEDTILDVTIALEALLIESGNQEMTHKLSLRAGALSHFFNDFSKTPNGVFKDIKKIYSCRSDIIHGYESKKLGKEIAFSEEKKLKMAPAAIQYLREILEVLINNPEFRKGNNIDKLILLNKNL